MREILRRGLRELGLDEDKAPALEAFARLVMERNRVMNLTAITGEEDFARLHLLDSATVLTVADLRGKSIVDVGTGAGFPGVPLCLLLEDARVTLLDSTRKRVDFLEEATRALGIANGECLCRRAEELAAERRESFDAAVSRAVAPLPVLCELCLPLVAPGGCFLAMKGSRSEEELAASRRAIERLGGELDRVAECPIPGSGVVHRIILVRKVSPTPAKYPRQYGIIKKKPL